jgi:hypothetical protein
MAGNYELTKDPQALCDSIDFHVERERTRLSFRLIMWKLAFLYAQGARRFDVFDPATGAIDAHFLDEEGSMEFQAQDLMWMIDRVGGQLAAMDVRLKALRKGMTLAAIRDRAITQVMGDGTTSDEQIEEAKTRFAYTLAALGCCGVVGHVEDHPTIGLSTDFEIIHPRELFPFPSLGHDYNKLGGLIRQHVVPLWWLKKKFGRRVARNLDRMYWWEAEAGAIPGDEAGYGDEGSGGGSFEYASRDRSGGSRSSPDKAGMVGMVRVEELWLMGHQRTVRRYAIKSGGYVLEDLTFDDLEVYPSIGMARFVENGTFHGLGLFDLLFSIHRQYELLLKSLFNNVRDLDRYGVVVMPQQQFSERAVLRDVGRGLRTLAWNPDASLENFRPFSITPQNLGDVPGKTAAFARDIMQSMSPWQDLLREKGRIDSQAGLSFLDEKIRQLMTTPSRAVERAWSDAHRAALGSVAREIHLTQRAVPVNQLTLDMAGVILDPVDDVVRFDRNPLPRLSAVTITIRESNPRSEIARKQEATALYALEGMQDPLGLKLLGIEEGLDFAIYSAEERAGYEMIVRQILLLYGDGESPGEIVTTPDTVMPDLQLRILARFMGSVTMAAASPEVQTEFIRYRRWLMEQSGMSLPEGVPNPDDLAMLMLQSERAGLLESGAGARSEQPLLTAGAPA